MISSALAAHGTTWGEYGASTRSAWQCRIWRCSECSSAVCFGVASRASATRLIGLTTAASLMRCASSAAALRVASRSQSVRSSAASPAQPGRARSRNSPSTSGSPKLTCTLPNSRLIAHLPCRIEAEFGRCLRKNLRPHPGIQQSTQQRECPVSEAERAKHGVQAFRRDTTCPMLGANSSLPSFTASLRCSQRRSTSRCCASV